MGPPPLSARVARGSIRPVELSSDPVAAFRAWFAEAEKTEPAHPEAASLATVGADGRPSLRMVLVKGADEAGFDFYTNFQSRKGRELAKHPVAALCFHWKTLERQVRIEGRVERLPDATSDAYWATRPRDSQLGGWASAQSETLGARAELDARVAELAVRFANRPVPRPEHWGGYRLVPDRIEFWQGRPNRLHDRLEFRRATPRAAWVIRRLQP